jgi:hypothetical protein
MVENVDIFEEETLDTPVLSSAEIRDKRREKIIHNLSKAIPSSLSWMTEELTVPFFIPSKIMELSSNIVGGPPIPNPMAVNDFIGELGPMEYEGGPIEKKVYEIGAPGAGLIGGAILYDKALDKIKAASPAIYNNLKIAFPYWVGHMHGGVNAIIEGTKESKGALSKAAAVAKGVGSLAKRAFVIPAPIRNQMGRNFGHLAKAGIAIGGAANILPYLVLSKPTGDATLDGARYKLIQEEAAKQGINIDIENIKLLDYSGTSLEGVLPNKYYDATQPYISLNQEDVDQAIWGSPPTQEELDEETKRLNQQVEDYEKLRPQEKVGEYFKEWGEWIGDLPPSKLLKKGMEFIETGEDAPKEKIYDMVSQTPEGIAAEAKDKAENERYIQDSLNIGQFPFVDEESTNALEITVPVGIPPANQMALGGDPGQFTDSMITGEEEDIDIRDIQMQPGFESIDDLDIFEEAKKQGYEEVQVANLFGKAPKWAIGNVDKFKMLQQLFTKNEKKILEDIDKKLGTEEEVLQKVEDIDIIDTPAGGTEVGVVKSKKTIIDSPEPAESVFYSGLEARLMDPNTPPSFSSADEFFEFLQQKGISKVETQDNILDNYIEIHAKNNVPLVTSDMLKIVRQAPMRNINTTTYGDLRYGGDKSPKYGGGHYESGEIPGSYREEVLFLDPKYIPDDPDSLPRAGHDFGERYVIGWSRLTDRKATLPVEKTPQGIAQQVDPSMIRTLKRNQTKLQNQLLGLEASAVRRLERDGVIELDNIDNLTREEMRNVLNETDNMAKLNSIDPALEQQIQQFRMKIAEDALKLQRMEATTKGQEVIVTFADEIQSDILQQAKSLENDLRESLGEILDLPKEKRQGELFRQRTAYRGKAKQVEPEVLEFYTQNETIFRPIFRTAEDMQQFVDEFRQNKLVFEEIAKVGPSPSDDLMKKMNIAYKKEQKMLEELNVGLSENALKQLYPNLPFKNRAEWGDALIKRDLAKAAKLLYQDKIPDAATWYAVSPAKFIKNRYGQKGGTNTPINERTSDMKGIGTEEFYGGPDSKSVTIDKSGTPDTNPNYGKSKHYTSVVEKALRRAAKENNSEFTIIKVDGIGEVYAIKITPEMLLPHKTHRKKGGMVYTPELIDIFEVA